MGKIQDAVNWAVQIANDDRYTYSQASRWGENFSYDCSSFVITAYQQAGVRVKSAGATYTGNMRSAFLACGFRDVTDQVNLASGTGMQLGDVLLNHANHTCMFIGNSRVVNAASSSSGIRVQNYYNYPWDCVLRYSESAPNAYKVDAEEANYPEVDTNHYVVKKGDTLWGIAEKYLSFGYRYADLMRWNNLKSQNIYPGQILSLVKEDVAPEKPTEETAEEDRNVITVKSGDTLWGLAGKHLGSSLRYVEIKQLNNLTSDTIYVGQKLMLP